MTKTTLTPDVIELVAQRFRALAEPARLQMLNCMRGGEMTVSELVDVSGLAQANVSKHLQMLYAMGFVARRKGGLFVHYALADQSVFDLCDVICGRIEAQEKDRRKIIAR